MVRVTGVEPAAGSGAYAALAAWRPFIILQEAAGSISAATKEKSSQGYAPRAFLVRVTGVEPAAS